MADTNAIEERLISFFAWYLDKPANWFSRDTNVRKAFRYRETWMALADTINDTKWMKALRATISQRDMVELKTIGELADLIGSSSGKKLNARLTRLAVSRKIRPEWLA